MRSLIRRRSDCGYDRAILIVVLLLVSVACGGCDAQTLTSANGPAYTLSSEPIFSIGGHDDRAEYQLQYVIGALHLSSGRVVIADAGPEELRYYDSRGQHEQTAGGAGEGPGEFRNLRSIGRMRGDTVVAWDPRLRGDVP